MKKAHKYILISFILNLLLPGISGYAQKSSARATVSPVEIVIGEQAIVDLEVIAPKGRSIIMPLYPDTLVKGIEVIKMLTPDTVIANEVMTIHQKYVITSFDSTLYHIAYMPIIDGTDTIKSNSFGLKVSSVILSEQVLGYLEQLKTQQTDSIDFEQLQLTDIKENLKPPFVWQDYLSYLWFVLLFLLILALIGVGLYLALRKKKKGYFFTPKEVLPPHAIAIKALDKIKAEKIWQRGLEKQYYTEVTDILREYIEKRFLINAFEKTSDEILDAMKYQSEADSAVDSLTQVLKLADLVKFAKYTPMPNENDLSLVNAYLFVNQTKIELPKPIDGKDGQQQLSQTVVEEKSDSNTPEQKDANS